MSQKRKPGSQAGIAIIGPGRVGQAMGRLLSRAGFRVQFVAARRLAAARRAARFVGAGRPVTIHSPALARAQIFLLTTSDAVIAPLAAQFASSLSDWAGKVVLHTCGSLSASVLTPLRRKGATIGSLHPFQTIPSPADGVRNLPSGYWAMEGDPAACRVAKRWVEALAGVAFKVSPEKKTLYHLAAFLVCPTLVTLMERSETLLKKSGIPPRISLPMLTNFVTETVRNFGTLGPRKSLTGPAARGDWPVIRAHLRALALASPDVLPVYKALLRAMLRLSRRRPPRDLRRLWE